MRSARQLLTLLMVAAFLGSACSESTQELAGTRRTPAPVVESTMPTVDGEAFTFAADPDDVLIVYFGYTFCPDVCPTTMFDISVAKTELEDAGERVDVAMVTVDPDRDDAEILSNYVNSFVPGSTALRTDDPALLQGLAEEFGVFYEVNTLDDGGIEVLHTGTLFAVDDAGAIVVSWPFGTPVGDMVNDLEILLEET